MRTVRWKMGVEVELLAPRGASRRTLAQAVARAEGGRVEPVFHRDAEPTTLEGTSHFFNLTHGFEVRRGRQVLFRFVDDVTLQRELDRAASPRHGWYRVLSDDLRLLNLALRRCDPRAAQSRVLQPLAQLFGTRATHSERMWRVADETGAPAYLACPLPGERERGCEVITAPLSRDHEARLEAMLTVARRLRFVAPHEGAVHLHFDGAALRSARVLRNFVSLTHPRRALLRALFRTNPACVRLGPWPERLVEVVSSSAFAKHTWAEARARLLETKPTKYCDLNLVNLLRGAPEKLTLEVRTLPVHLTAGPIIDAAVLCERMLRWSLDAPDAKVEAERPPTPQAARELFTRVGLPDAEASRLLANLARPD